MTVVSGSRAAFDIYVEEFSINLHDRFSYTRDPGTVAAVANTAVYGGFDNTVGISVSRDFLDFVPSVGYDHRNFVASSSQFAYQDSASELLNGRAGFRFQSDGGDRFGSRGLVHDLRSNDSQQQRGMDRRRLRGMAARPLFPFYGARRLRRLSLRSNQPDPQCPGSELLLPRHHPEPRHHRSRQLCRRRRTRNSSWSFKRHHRGLVCAGQRELEDNQGPDFHHRHCRYENGKQGATTPQPQPKNISTGSRAISGSCIRLPKTSRPTWTTALPPAHRTSQTAITLNT